MQFKLILIELNKYTMKTHFKLIPVWIILSFFFIFTACDNENEDNNDESDTLSENVTEINDENLITYLIPSPKDMFAFTNEGELEYSDKVLNNKENADKYLDTKSKEVGFGIYSADLAYTAAFNQTNTAGEYLKIVEDLSDKIGLGSVFTESLIERFKEVDSKDSLLKVTNDTYYDIVKFLEENDRNTSLSLISVGGWVESLYIVTSLQDTYDENNRIIQLIADQKNIFENLILSLEQRNTEASISEILEQLKPIKAVYDELEVIKIENPASDKPSGNQIMVGGTTKIVMTQEQYTKLKESIAQVRTNLAEASV